MWFAVSLLFESVHPDDRENDRLWEERIILVHAASEEEARQEGERIGKAEEHKYIAANGERVQWVFRQIESVWPLESLDHGAELFSRFLSKQEVESMLSPFQAQ
jgi:hypothetical protein